jgi:hypothetical protein
LSKELKTATLHKEINLTMKLPMGEEEEQTLRNYLNEIKNFIAQLYAKEFFKDNFLNFSVSLSLLVLLEFPGENDKKMLR